MKKYLIALLFGMSLMAMQSASAATLTLSLLSGSGSVVTGSGSESSPVSGSGSSATFWEVTLSGLGAGGTANLDLSTVISGPISNFAAGFLGTNGIGLSDGVYTLAILLLPSTSSYTFEVALSNVAGGVVPVPAALWLFGSALLGLVGVTGRKSKAPLAA
jgi:hypothetical protein